MPTLSIVNFNIVCATAGGFVTLFGLVSFLCKEKFYLSEALISSIFGVIFGPHAANFIRPLDYANGSELDLETITLYFTRLVLGVQLVLAGVQLPSKYLRKEWRSLSILLGPGMCIMWMVTSLLVWALVPDVPFLFALAVGSCVTPTDPILSNSIVKGKFADKNIPPSLQKIIIAESGANDGLGYPFLFLALYLIKYTEDQGLGTTGGGAGRAMGLWFSETWCYVIIMSVAYGAIVGWLAKELLHWAEERRYVDRESFLVFAITLALFIVGTVGMIGSDDVLACFIAGNVFTWDDWFRLETEDDSLQPTIDMLLNVAIFMWFGAVCPWHMFVANNIIPIYRLVPLGILVLLLRRLPMILGFHKWIHQVEDLRRASFLGFFGPIGVSAIFYLYISKEFLRDIEYQGTEREDALRLEEMLDVVVWFLVVCSIVVHGLSIPLGKLGFYLPRTISTALSTDRLSLGLSTGREPTEATTPADPQTSSSDIASIFRRRRGGGGPADSSAAPSTANPNTHRLREVPSGPLRAAKSDEDFQTPAAAQANGSTEFARDVDGGSLRPQISRPMNPRAIGRAVKDIQAAQGANGEPGGFQRSIRFGDEQAGQRDSD